MGNRMIWLAGCALLAGCGGGGTPAKDVASNDVTIASPTAPAAPPDMRITDGWIGVEGLALDVKVGDAPGRYKLHLALMDGAGDYAGTAEGEAIRFTRDGVAEKIRHTNGAETGLKWLAEKRIA